MKIPLFYGQSVRSLGALDLQLTSEMGQSWGTEPLVCGV